MNKPLRTLDFYCIIIGILLIVQGIYNLVNPPFLGVFTSNSLLAILHILLGIGGVWTAFKGGTYFYSIFLGIFLLIVGILYFIPPARLVMVDIFNVNAPVAWLNLLFGVVSLLVAFLGRKLASRFSVQ